MRRLMLGFLMFCGIFNIAMAAKMSDEEAKEQLKYCIEGNEVSCKYLMNSLADDFNSHMLEQCKSADDCYSMGVLYESLGSNHNAMKFYHKAITFGDEHALGNLADLYKKQKDYVNARIYYEQACIKSKSKSIQAQNCYKLGNMYYNGEGVTQNYNTAIFYYSISCGLKVGGSSNGCDMLGSMFYNGKGREKDISAAREIFNMSCKLGSKFGCDNYKKINNMNAEW